MFSLLWNKIIILHFYLHYSFHFVNCWLFLHAALEAIYHRRKIGMNLLKGDICYRLILRDYLFLDLRVAVNFLTTISAFFIYLNKVCEHVLNLSQIIRRA